MIDWLIKYNSGFDIEFWSTRSFEESMSEYKVWVCMCIWFKVQKNGCLRGMFDLNTLRQARVVNRALRSKQSYLNSAEAGGIKTCQITTDTLYKMLEWSK